MSTEANFMHAFWRISALIFAICAISYISTQQQTSNDFWLQAKIGEIIVADHAIPATLLFPFTEINNQPFNAHEWLPSVLFYYFVKEFGESSLPLILGFLGLLLFGLSIYLPYKRGNNNLPLSLILGLISLSVENFRHFLRPELISLFLIGIYWHLLDALKSKNTVLNWFLILITTILWSNTHGSAVLAPIMSSIYAIGIWLDIHKTKTLPKAVKVDKPRIFFILTLSVFFATLINPAGWNLWKFVVDFEGSHLAKQYISEWFPPFDRRLYNLPGLWIGGACGIATAIVCAFNWKKLSWVDLLMFFMFSILALKAVRFLVYLGFATSFLMSSILTFNPKNQQTEQKLYMLATVLSILILALAIIFGNANGEHPHKSRERSVLTEPMKRVISNPSIHGNVYNSYDLGAELVYRGYPRLRPSIDSRIDSYGDDYFLFHEILLTDDAKLSQFVHKYNVRYMLLTHDDFLTLLAGRKLTNIHWKIHAADNHVIFLERNEL